MTARAPQQIILFLADRFPFLSLATCTETLRIANRELGQQAFVRRIITADGAPVMSSSGMEVRPEAAISAVETAPAVVVLSSYEPERACTPAVLGWLRRLERRGARLACADTGGYLLARAGVLRGRRIAVHHETMPAYAEALPPGAVLDAVSGDDGGLLSSGGGAATADVMLALIAGFTDRALADRVAHVLNYRPLPPQARPGENPVARADPRLGRMIELMEASLDAPLSLTELCALCGVEPSTARRLFHRWLGQAPLAYYTRLRLERADRLLAHSALPVSEIAALAGYGDPAAFSRAFRRQFGACPSDRRMAPAGS